MKSATKLLPLLIVLFLHMGLWSQNSVTIEGKILDAISSAPLIAANISLADTPIGTITDDKGRFSLTVPTSAKQLTVSYIGYETQVLKIEEFLTVYMKRGEEFLDVVTIRSAPLIEPLTERYESVVDFSVEENRLLLLTKERVNGYVLKLMDFEGNNLDKINLDSIKNIDKLTTSCMNSHFILSEYYAYQIDLTGNKISLLHKDKKSDYERFIANCLASNSQYFYMSSISGGDQVSEISGHHKHLQKVVNFGRIQDDFNASNFKEEKHYLDFMENKGEDNWINLTTSKELESFYNYWEKAALLYYNFYLPVNYYLHAEEHSVFIFDHEKHVLNKFALNGKLIYQRPIQYSKDRNWSKKIYKDSKTNLIYTYMNYRSGKLLVQIDSSTGEVIPVVEFDLSFIEDFKIYDETVYFTNSGLVAGQEARILKKMKI